MLQRITSWSYRHRRLVVALWLAVLVSVNLAGSAFGGESKQEFLSPGTDSKAAVDLLDERFPDRAGDTVTVVIHDEAGATSPAGPRPWWSRWSTGSGRCTTSSTSSLLGTRPGPARSPPTARPATPSVRLDTTGARFPVDVAEEMVDLADQSVAAGVQMELSGQAIENVQSSSMGAEGPGLAIAALILLVAFGSLVAMGLPLATALFGVGIGLAAGKLVANLLDVPEWASSVAIMIGLGVGIDYALLILTRYRSELATGAEPREACRTAMATAGRSVVFAGVTVVISLLGMLTMNQPYVPGVGVLGGAHRRRGAAGRPDPAPGPDRVRRPQHRPAADPAAVPRVDRRGLLAPLEPAHPAPPDRHRAARGGGHRRAHHPGLGAAPRLPRRRQRPHVARPPGARTT